MKWSTSVLAILFALSISSGVRARNLDVSQKEKAKASVNLDDVQLDADPLEAPPPAAALQALAKADTFEKAKNFTSVIKVLKPTLEMQTRKGLLQLARAYRLTNDSMNEIHTLELVVAKNPKDYVAQALLGDAYLKAKRYDDAGKAFQASRALNSRYRPAYEGIWQTLEQSDSKYEARTLVLDMIKNFGPDAKTTAAICRSYSDEDFLEKAIEACRAAIATDPKNPENYVHLTTSLRDQDHKAEATKTIESAAHTFSKSEEVQSLAGELRAADKNYIDAYGFYQKAVAADPKSVRAQVGFAKSAFELQKHPDAIVAFKAACRLDRKTGRDFRAAYLQLKNSKDPSAHLYESDLDACN